MSGKGVPGSEKSKFKGPEAGVSLTQLEEGRRVVLCWSSPSTNYNDQAAPPVGQPPEAASLTPSSNHGIFFFIAFPRNSFSWHK